MPVVTLPDGSSRSYDEPISIADIAADIGPGLAKAALAGTVDGRMVDTSFLIDSDVALAIITGKSDEALELIEHNAETVLEEMGEAVLALDAKHRITVINRAAQDLLGAEAQQRLHHQQPQADNRRHDKYEQAVRLLDGNRRCQPGAPPHRHAFPSSTDRRKASPRAA